jgi:hypothetical protein
VLTSLGSFRFAGSLLHGFLHFNKADVLNESIEANTQNTIDHHLSKSIVGLAEEKIRLELND